MSIWSQEIFEVVCDSTRCFNSAPKAGEDFATTEAQAIRTAEANGFEKIDDHWYCPDCVSKRSKKKKRR